jgi:hypothetical protein
MLKGAALRKLVASLCLISLAITLCLATPRPALAQQDSGFTIAMPVEYVNYTIVPVNGALWAKIDGVYPMHISGDLPDTLPMVYPTPPQTTNISITLDGKQLAYSNYTEAYPSALHHTAIGDWAMVAAVLSPISESFTLKIHYEHPLQVVNDSFLFLYDLNISPYLSPENNNSTAYFTFRMPTNASNIKAFTTETDTKWNPTNYTIRKDGDVDVVSVVMHSEYGKPLLGDLAIEFSSPDVIPEIQFMPLIILFTVLSCVLILAKKKSSKTYD